MQKFNSLAKRSITVFKYPSFVKGFSSMTVRDALNSAMD